jgi:hypothetical protein
MTVARVHAGAGRRVTSKPSNRLLQGHVGAHRADGGRSEIEDRCAPLSVEEHSRIAPTEVDVSDELAPLAALRSSSPFRVDENPNCW